MKHYIHNTTLAAAGLALVALLHPAAEADRVVPLVAPHVTEVMTVSAGRIARRAITGIDRRGPYLVIEEVARGEVVSQRRLTSAELDGHRFELGRERIALAGWRGAELSFTVGHGRDLLSCVLDAGPGGAARCQSRLAEQEPPRGHEERARLEAAGRLCDGALADRDLRDRCVSLVLDARTEMAPLVAACDAGFDGDAAELGCIAAATRRPADAPALIAACESSFDGDAAELSCVQTMVDSRLPLAAVNACVNNMDGDANEQTCLSTLAGSRGDPLALLAQCVPQRAGDAAELACLGRVR